jgi:hypothetical protein
MATLAGEALYASFGYRSVERSEAAMPGGLTLAVIRMERPVLGGAVQAP